MLSSHLFLGLPSALFSSGFPTRTLYTPLSMRVTRPNHLILLDFITRTILKTFPDYLSYTRLGGLQEFSVFLKIYFFL